MDELYLVVSPSEGSDDFVGVFSSIKKATEFVSTIFNSHPFYKIMRQEPVEMGSLHIWFQINDNKCPERHYYISKLTINKGWGGVENEIIA